MTSEPRRRMSVTRFPSVVRVLSRLAGIGALIALVSGKAGVPGPLVVLGFALVAPGAARLSVMVLRPPRLRAYARQAFIEAEAAKAFKKRFRRGNTRPKPLRTLPSSQPAAAQFTARATKVHGAVGPGEYSRTCRSLSWTGSTLKLVDKRGSTLRWSTVSGGVLRGTRLRPPAPAPDLGDSLVAEIAVTQTRRTPLDRVHLLDRWSRRLATIPVVGFTEQDLVTLARHAGVAFTLYEMPARVKATPDALAACLFPRSVFFREVAGIGPEWRWLERLRLIGRFFTGMAETSLWDPQADLAARRASRSRR